MLKISTFLFLSVAAAGAIHRRQEDVLRGLFECPLPDMLKGCHGPKDCLYRNPEDCTTFIQCTPNPLGLGGRADVYPCPPGNLEWDDKVKECDIPNGSCYAQ